ncbi:unnamed protein product [Cylicocyclus nassatus]|uniref:Uncharacterized protein n=1 Tax=Cylicocyclus nassatus TaxID=53992 RepID=A0AA36M673_CYLNA|nr:unnamed protein product [Cylicocyclus nassatus]
MEQRLTQSHRTSSETTLNRQSGEKNNKSLRFEPPPAPAHPQKNPAANRSERTHVTPSLISVNFTTEPVRSEHQPSTNGGGRSRDILRGPDEDYPERLMSPPPTKEPRSIIKQGYYSSQQNLHSNSSTMQVDRGESRTLQSKSTSFNDLPEEQRYRIMQENLERLRRSRATTPKPPVTSFNGPFFKLEEVNASKNEVVNGGNDYSLREMNESRASFADSRALSDRKQNFLRLKYRSYYNCIGLIYGLRTANSIKNQIRTAGKDASVVIWPPLNDKKQHRSQSVMARSITDPERINEYRRQKQMEEEAMRRHEKEKVIAMTKQMRAMQVQQQRLYEQRHGVTSPVQFIDVIDNTPYSSQQQLPIRYGQSPAPGQMSPDYGYDPHRMRVYETRPISALSEMSDTGLHNTWKRTYIVEKPDDIAKNEILRSAQLLEREQYDVDLLKRRAAFVEKPEEKPEIIRTGRKWQPPPEKPYVWPSVPRAASVDISVPPIDYNMARSTENVEYQWAPVVTDPGFKQERKNFTPTNSPPMSPRGGHGTGPLDEAAKRQTRYVIQPSPDGSHRPEPAFRKERVTPSGGFYPHAPNAVKIVKYRPASAQGLLAPVEGTTEESVDVIHQRNFHRIDGGYRNSPSNGEHYDRKAMRKSQPSINDWEKIYDLPPHSSTIVGKDMPTNINVKRRLSHFQGSVQNLQRRQENARTYQENARSYSMDGSLPYLEHGSMRDVSSPQASTPRQDRSQSSSRRETPRQQSRRTQEQHPSTSGQNSRPSSSVPISPASRSDTPTAIRVRTKMGQVTAPGPSPKSYDRARQYVPRPLPPGYTNEDLDELARKGEQLLERSRERRAGYKLIDSEIVKEGPEPVPQAFKDQVRDLLESRNSLETSTTKEHDRSGYVTDVSTATWQFSTQSFSPRSIVSVNGARDDILKREKERVWPSYAAQESTSVAESGRSSRQMQEVYDRKVERFASMPLLTAADRTFIRVKDDKPRSIMKRRELETRDQMLHPSAENQLMERQYHRTQSNVSKPSVTETVQRFAETRRTEEVERRVQRKERRDRRSRQHSSSRQHASHGSRDNWENGYSERRIVSVPPQRIVYQESNRAMSEAEIDKVVREAYAAADEARRDHYRMRSSSLSRGGGAVNGYLPASQETYYRQTSTKRERDLRDNNQRYEDEHFGRGLAHARYGSLSDSLRRGELKYIPNGEVRESHWSQQQQSRGGGMNNMHKSYSTRDVFGGDYDRRSNSSYRRGSQQMSPFVEFPPTLPRSYDDDMSRLEAEFLDSLLMPLPNGNMHERDYRTEHIPGGYETFQKDNRANSGRRIGKDGLPVDYSEATQEYSYKREQEMDRRR